MYSKTQSSLVFLRNKTWALFVIVVIICIIVLTQLEHNVVDISPLRTIQNYYKCNNTNNLNFTAKNLTRGPYQPRLGNKLKRILYWTTFTGRKKNLSEKLKCGPNKKLICELVSDRTLVETSHALIFHGWREDLQSTRHVVNGTIRLEPKEAPPVRYSDQYWVLYMMEPPQHFKNDMLPYDSLFNWTWNYRLDSDIFMPYGKFEMLGKPIHLPTNKSMILPPKKNKTVVWVISNCRDVRSKRLDLVKKLQKHIQVDIYGKCGTLNCPSKDCKGVLGKQYKFYLALENSLCQDYVTEKVFHAFSNGMVPIVYGSANYDLFLPRGSYINMNSFATAKSLAEYLHYLDNNPHEYMKHFKWKSYLKLKDGMDFKGAYCKLCEKIHRDYPTGLRKIIPSMRSWLMFNWDKDNRACNEPLSW